MDTMWEMEQDVTRGTSAAMSRRWRSVVLGWCADLRPLARLCLRRLAHGTQLLYLEVVTNLKPLFGDGQRAHILGMAEAKPGHEENRTTSTIAYS
jgi:hypothetical protein